MYAPFVGLGGDKDRWYTQLSGQIGVRARVVVVEVVGCGEDGGWGMCTSTSILSKDTPYVAAVVL